LHRGKRYVHERSPIKSRFEPSSTDAFICSSFGSVKLRINPIPRRERLIIDGRLIIKSFSLFNSSTILVRFIERQFSHY